MDRNIIAIHRTYADHEEAATAMCYTAAHRAGRDEQQADECDDASLGCAECPFGRDSEVRQ